MELIEEKIKEQLVNKYDDAYGVVKMIRLNGFTCALFRNNQLEFYFEDAEYSVDYFMKSDNTFDLNESTGGTHKKGYSACFTVGLKTPKGYISSKRIPVDFEYNEKDLTLEQGLELLKYETDAVKNTFDPFYNENEAKRKNASAWNYIAQNFITDPYCTK